MAPFRRIRRSLTAALIALACSGCGGSQPLVASGTMRFVAPLPPSRGPGLGPAHTFFLDVLHGYVATTGGAWYVPKTGIQPPLVAAEIDETRDGGATWRTLLGEPRAAFDAIAFSDRIGYALGSRVTSSRWPFRVRAFALATTDGGRRWHAIAPPFSAGATRNPTPGGIPVGVQAFREEVVAEIGARVERSRDGGRTWSRVAVPARTTLVRFASREVGYAGVAARCRGGETLWRTLDGGSSWRLVPRTCGPFYADVDAHGRLVATAQGNTAMEIGGRRSLVRLSVDAGANWRVVADKRTWPSVARVHFVDRRHGWALSAESDQGFERDALHVTADAGRTWHVRAEPPALEYFEPAPAPAAFAGASLWAGAPNDGLLWHSRDLGRRWTVSFRPQYAQANDVLVARGRLVVARTNAGILRSVDGGRTWHPLGALSARGIARASAVPAYVAVRGPDLVQIPFLSRDGGRTWRRLQTPARARGAVAFADSRHGLAASADTAGDGPSVPVYVTDDAGRTWRPVRFRVEPVQNQPLALAPRTIAMPTNDALFVSSDDGDHWVRLPAPPGYTFCGASRPTPRDVWLLCSNLQRTLLLVSHDAGSHWVRRRTAFRLRTQILATGPREAWTATFWDLPTPTPQALWHTVDGGATWHAVWPRISPATPVPLSSH
jgi:photosystem II stability/assembly factor-like uncharacterized protein